MAEPEIKAGYYRPKTQPNGSGSRSTYTPVDFTLYRNTNIMFSIPIPELGVFDTNWVHPRLK
jgi:hypothetical protein